VPEPPTATPQPEVSTTEPAPLVPEAQSAALLPDFQSDLVQANNWNRYSIEATIDPAARTFTGRERLEYTNRDTATLEQIYFHLYPNLPDFGGQLEIHTVAIDGQAMPVNYEQRRYLLRVDLRQPLPPGASVAVSLEFTTRAPENAAAKYGAFNKQGGVLALASSYPIAAMVRGGAWDIGWPDGRGDFVNSETALYALTLTAPADWQLITTGVAIDGRLDGGQQEVAIVSGPQRDVMIALAQYQVVSADAGGTRINSYFRPGQDAGGQLALDSAVRAVRAFNARYGRYPLAELDLLEVDARTFLGVEYPGMILLQSNLYANRPGGLEITTAHEVGHQWWYSIVGNNVQTEAWLDEALASYSEIVYAEEVGGAAAAERALEGFRQRYRDVVAAGRDAPIEQPTAAFQGNYVALVYGKAVLFFQALRTQIGDAAFDRFLHEYYAQHRYGFVGGGDLLASAENACGCELDELYANWITRVAPVEIP
jgi:aminopeptidase N